MAQNHSKSGFPILKDLGFQTMFLYTSVFGTSRGPCGSLVPKKCQATTTILCCQRNWRKEAFTSICEPWRPASEKRCAAAFKHSPRRLLSLVKIVSKYVNMKIVSSNYQQRTVFKANHSIILLMLEPREIDPHFWRMPSGRKKEVRMSGWCFQVEQTWAVVKLIWKSLCYKGVLLGIPIVSHQSSTSLE